MGMDLDPKKLIERLGLSTGAISGQKILAAGAVLFLALMVAALIPHDPTTAGPVAGGTPGTAPATAVTAAMAGLSPFTPSPPMQFGGRVTEVASIGNEVGWGQIHIWIDDGTGTLREISVAPQSYLEQIGCPPFNGTRVSGIGVKFDAGRPAAELYAKTITVGGQTCRLRDDEGLALWLNAGR